MRTAITASTLVLLLGLSACTKSEDDSTNTNAATTSSVSVQASVNPAPATPPPIAQPVQIAPPGATATSASTANGVSGEYNGEVVTHDDDGKTLDGMALLKKAMMIHVEGKGFPYPERIEELVEKGTLKSLPPTPEGKKWAIDPASKQIVLQ